jgi:hypothetical protein
MPNIPRAQIGKPYDTRASTFNYLRAGADLAHAQANNPSPEGSPRQFVVLVRNTGATTLQRFDAVEILRPVIDDSQDEATFDRLPGFDVAHPEDPEVVGAVAIVQVPIAVGGTGRAIVFGVSVCREITVEDEAHTRASPGAMGELVTNEDGPFAILWKNDDAQATRRGIVAVVQAGPGRTPAAKRWVRITGSTKEDEAYRWEYDLELVELNADGDWEAIPDEDPLKGRNTLEAGNSDAGVQGNGVNADTIPQGFDIVAIADGAVVEAEGPYAIDGEPDSDFWIFTETNMVDGTC